MRLKFTLYICLSFLAFITTEAIAASAGAPETEVKIDPRELDRYQRVTTRYTEGYNAVLKELREGMREGGRINMLRTYYPQTKQYTPFSKNIIDLMTYQAYIADTSADQAEINDALAQYRVLLNDHMANLDVITFALTLARVDVRYGDEIFIKKMRDGLIKSLTDLENIGKTPERAYMISSYGEETYVLNQYGGTLQKSEIHNVGRLFYNVHDIILPNGQFEQIYMDVTAPIRNVKMKQILRERSQRTVIPGQ